MTEATSGHVVDNRIFTLCHSIAWSVEKHTEKDVKLKLRVLQVLHCGKASLRYKTHIRQLSLKENDTAYLNCSNMITNFTDKESQITIEQLYCSAQLGGKVHGYLILLSVIDIFLSITAILGNILILAALRKETSLHPPSKLLLRNLAITDLCVGIIVEPLSAIYWASEATERCQNICRYASDFRYVTGFVLCAVSLMTMTSISVDRLLALLLGLRYRQVVTLKRSYIAITILWVGSIHAGTIYFVNPLVTSWLGNIGILLCIVISIVSYSKIFLTLRYNHIQPQQCISQAQSNQATLLNMARFRKAVSSTLWIQVTLVVCCLPFFFSLIITPQGDPLPYYLATQSGLVFLYLNSSLNPLLYCWKIKEVRQAVKDTIKQVSCSFF